MNIIFYKDNGIVPEKGGISRITANLAKIFRERGNKVWFVGTEDKFIGADYDKEQIFLPLGNNIESKENITFLNKFIIEHKVDVIINQNCSSIDHVNLLYNCGQYTGAKIIFCFHNSILTHVYNYAYTRQFMLQIKRCSWLFNILENRIVRQIGIYACIAKYNKLYKNIIDKCDSIVLLCEGQIKELERASKMHPIPKAHVIYNSMTLPIKFNSEKKKHVLWVGNFDYHIKRPDNMLRIWSKVESKCPDWKLYMLGDGCSLGYCKQMAVNLGLRNVIFTGRVNPQKYYDEAEILCTTSVHECFPMILLEGMNNDMALVAFDSFTSAKLLVKEKDNGKLAKAFDIKEYSDTLLTLMTDTKERHRLQSNAKISAERFSEERIYDMWMDLFNKMLDTKSSDRIK